MRRVRQPLGRTEGLQRRQRAAQAQWERSAERARRRDRSHTGLWAALAGILAAGVLVCGFVLFSALSGDRALFAVVNGELILKEQREIDGFRDMQEEMARLQAVRTARLNAGSAPGNAGEGEAAQAVPIPQGDAAAEPTAAPQASRSAAGTAEDTARWPLVARYQGRLGPGIIIDGLDVSGMTQEEAEAALERIPAEGGGQFSIRVTCAGETYTIDSNRVPMTRNIPDVVRDALAVSWEDMPATDLTGTTGAAAVAQNPGETPFEARLRTLRETESARASRLDQTEALLAARQENPLYFSTEWTFDRDSIRAFTDEIAQAGSTGAENAYIADFDPVSKTFAVAPEVNGIRVDPDALHEDVMACLDRGDLYGTVNARTETVWAEENAQTLAARLGRISGYTTHTTSNANRNTNIRLSAEAINGFRVDPGVNFSFNTVVGQRTERKGYRPAAAISGGQSVDEIGGGVCQTSSTLFNAVARGNFEVVHRSPHAWPSSYVDKGLDATVDWPNLDFVWKNNTEYPVFICAHYENRNVTVELWGVTLGEGISIDLEGIVTETIPIPEGVANVRNESLPAGTRRQTVTARRGYVVETWQVWKHDGFEISRNLLCTSRYKAYQETWEYN